MLKQGWYEDPADRHELRWFSAGGPTDLVQDGDTTALDPLSIDDPALFGQMELDHPVDATPLKYQPDAGPRPVPTQTFGCNATHYYDVGRSDWIVWPAGGAELALIVLPIVVGAFLLVGRVIGDATFGLLLLVSLAITLAGRANRGWWGQWRRRRRG